MALWSRWILAAFCKLQRPVSTAFCSYSLLIDAECRCYIEFPVIQPQLYVVVAERKPHHATASYRRIFEVPSTNPCALAPAAVAPPSVTVTNNLIRTLATVRLTCHCGTWTLRTSAGTCPRTGHAPIYSNLLPLVPERIARFDTIGHQR